MNFGITGKWALVCGASKGLGFGCAQALAREGANVVIVARGAEALQAAAEKLRNDPELPQGTQVEPIAVDLGAARGEQVEVLSGLMAGDRVVVAGGHSLSAGAAVKPVTTQR